MVLIKRRKYKSTYILFFAVKCATFEMYGRERISLRDKGHEFDLKSALST